MITLHLFAVYLNEEKIDVIPALNLKDDRKKAKNKYNNSVTVNAPK